MRGLVIVSIMLAAASASAQPFDVSGDYNGTWGRTTLRQFGDHVLGMYNKGRATIDGTIDNTTLRFTWTEGARSGRGVLAIAGDGSLAGTWGNDQDDRNGGAWILTRVIVTPPVAMGPGGILVPQPPFDPTLGLFAPPRHKWTFGYRFYWDAMLRTGAYGFGVGGFGLELERRFFERWSVGVNGDLSIILADTGMYGPGTITRLRAGLSVRRDLDEKRRRWVGVRGGAETIDSGKTTGQFAELSIGSDWHLGVLSMGVYGFVGLSREPASAFGTGGTSPTGAMRVIPPGDVTSPVVGFGMRITH
jgi:hypothetical protein